MIGDYITILEGDIRAGRGLFGGRQSPFLWNGRGFMCMSTSLQNYWNWQRRMANMNGCPSAFIFDQKLQEVLMKGYFKGTASEEVTKEEVVKVITSKMPSKVEGFTTAFIYLKGKMVRRECFEELLAQCREFYLYRELVQGYVKLAELEQKAAAAQSSSEDEEIKEHIHLMEDVKKKLEKDDQEFFNEFDKQRQALNQLINQLAELSTSSLPVHISAIEEEVNKFRSVRKPLTNILRAIKAHQNCLSLQDIQRNLSAHRQARKKVQDSITMLRKQTEQKFKELASFLPEQIEDLKEEHNQNYAFNRVLAFLRGCAKIRQNDHIIRNYQFYSQLIANMSTFLGRAAEVVEDDPKMILVSREDVRDELSRLQQVFLEQIRQRREDREQEIAEVKGHLQECLRQNQQLTNQDKAKGKEIQELKLELMEANKRLESFNEKVNHLNAAERVEENVRPVIRSKQLSRIVPEFQESPSIFAHLSRTLRDPALLYQLNEKLTARKFTSAELLYRFDSKNPTNIHQYIDNKPNLLFVASTAMQTLGAFCSHPLTVKSKGVGADSFLFIFKELNLEVFPLMKGKDAFEYNKDFLIFGRNDLRVDSGGLRFTTRFGDEGTHYETGGKRTADFWEAAKGEDVSLEAYEVYQLLKEGEKAHRAEERELVDSTIIDLPEESAEEKLERLEQELSAVALKLQEQEGVVRLKEEELTKIKSDCQFQIKVSRESAEALKVRVELQTAEIMTLNTALLNEKQQKAKLQELVKLLEEANRKLTEEISILQQRLTELSQKNEQLAFQCQESEMLLAANESKLNNANLENESLSKSLNKQKLQREAVEEQVRALQQREERGRDYSAYFPLEIMLGRAAGKQFVIGTVEEEEHSRVQWTRLLYRYDPLNKTNFHSYVDGIPYLLLLIHLKNGRVLACYTNRPFVAGSTGGGNGLLMVVTSERTFYLRRGGRAIAYDEYYLIFGNSEVRLKSGESVVYSNFGIANAFFENQGLSVDVLFGEGKDGREVPFHSYEIYQLVFEG